MNTLILEPDIDIRFNRKEKTRYKWVILRDIPITLSNGDIIIIPAGMRTDLRSSPRWLWSIIPPYNEALLAYIIHDYLYIYDYKVKELGLRKAQRFADFELLYWFKVLEEKTWDNYISFITVRIFGHQVFKELRAV